MQFESNAFKKKKKTGKKNDPRGEQINTATTFSTALQNGRERTVKSTGLSDGERSH